MRRSLASAAAGALALALLAAVLLASTTAAAQDGAADPDLTGVSLGTEDLPSGFAETADLFTIGGLVAELLDRVEGGSVHQRRVFANSAGTEAVESLLIGPLSPAAQEDFDVWLTDQAAVAQTVADAVPPFGTSGTWVVRPPAIGDSSFGCSITATEERIRASDGAQPAASSTRLDVILARRGPYLLVVAVTHDGEGDPVADSGALAAVLDRRLAEALGLPTGGFRPPGLLEPELTTRIPTPSDISTDPAVIGANLLLAGLAMLAFVVASELLDNALAEQEALLQGVLRPARWLAGAQRRLDAALATRLGTGRRLDRARLVGIVAIYGLVFSFLEPGWHPFSITGSYLFLALAIACGLVGISGDLAKRAAARRRQIPTRLELHPANLIMAVASTACSRAFSLTPGLLFGRPEALEVDEDTLQPPRGGRVLGAGALTLLAVGLGAWLLTMLTSLRGQGRLPGWLGEAIGGLEALLLLAFAVAVQNLFLEMLNLPGTAGRYLSRRHRWLWLLALTGAAFAFWHTLINPRGNLATALGTANTRFFLGVIASYLALAGGLRWYASRRRRADPGGASPVSTPDDASSTARSAAVGAKAPAGWYADPSGRHQHRYWDGTRWTPWVADAGVTSRDPPTRR